MSAAKNGRSPGTIRQQHHKFANFTKESLMRRSLAASVAVAVVLALGLCQFAWSVPAEPPKPAAEEKLPEPPPDEVLQKIEAPAVAPVIKTKGGYTIKLDLSQQVLSVVKPKSQILVSPQVEANQTVETKQNTVLQQGTTPLAQLRKGRLLYARDVKQGWALTHVVEGGKTIRGWVRASHLKPVAEDSPPFKTLSVVGDDPFAPAAVLIQKAKQFDDGLYAAVELAMQDGLGPVTGKRDWLARLAAKVNAQQGGVPLAQLYAAAALGGSDAAIPSTLNQAVARQRQTFLADQKVAKPLGFYTWTPQLQSIFRQDRLLQSPLRGNEHAAGITAMARALAADAEDRKSYEQVLGLNERLTNPLKTAGYRELLPAAAEGTTLPLSDAPVSFLPPSRGPETDLILRLYGNRLIPEGFSLMDEVVARLKSGALSLAPRADSGWYDHQLWSIEPLVRLDATPEGKRLQPNDEYSKHLQELFKGTYALARETHLKQLEHPPAESAAPPVKEREKVYIQPNPHVEILPTMYLRRAQSYAYVRGVLEDTFGKEHVPQLHRQSAAGPVSMNLADELASMERLFAGAHIVACRDLGLAEDAASAAAGEPDESARHFLRWLASIRSDGDVARDARMMVPVFYDVPRRKTKVWVVLGWTSSPAVYGYAQQPAATVTGPDGKPAAGEEAPELIFNDSWRSLASPVFAEVYVSRLLNRDEFRQHCDAYATQAAILNNLE
jgi:hypothetical protein